MNNGKTDKIINEITSVARPLIENAERQGKEDYWKLEVKNHNGKLNIRFEVQIIKKVY